MDWKEFFLGILVIISVWTILQTAVSLMYLKDMDEINLNFEMSIDDRTLRFIENQQNLTSSNTTEYLNDLNDKYDCSGTLFQHWDNSYWDCFQKTDTIDGSSILKRVRIE